MIETLEAILIRFQDARTSYVNDVEFSRYANTRNIEDWVEEVRRESSI